MTAALACTRCSAELRPTAKFCDECGSPTAARARRPNTNR
ncbi:MAG TPA: zinc-ribbon domain-containing protein [Mycobacterium sp.]|nr:zinc-ribbon domain-containing protein [Mycobacterium sp.]